jgi:glucan phosphoethanolaminetransferase (alkaline phosphatase superfamily)
MWLIVSSAVMAVAITLFYLNTKCAMQDLKKNDIYKEITFFARGYALFGYYELHKKGH